LTTSDQSAPTPSLLDGASPAHHSTVAEPNSRLVTPLPNGRHIYGLVLAGAAGKGPFAAGALGVIARNRPPLVIVNVVGASSGALNAAVFAAGLATDTPERAADELVRLWRDHATWWRVLTRAQQIGIVVDALRTVVRNKTASRRVRLRMSLTSLRGEVRPLVSAEKDPHKKYRDDGARARHTRYEETYTFTEHDLLDEREHEKIAEAAVSSSAIPVVLSPGFVGTKGPYMDGGIVDNAPISLAIRDHDEVDRVLVVTPEPTVVRPRGRLGRFSVRTLLEIVINERLARDIDSAHRINRKLARLFEVVPSEVIEERTEWRHLEIIEIRPEARTPGGFISGFFSKHQRMKNLELGQRAADKALGDVGFEIANVQAT
jgi:predicted acylesterase/phospholipase RssA